MDGIMKTPTLTITAAIVVPFALACVTLSPKALAVCQEGCDLDKINTFLGDDALINNTTGDANVAVGTSALFTNTTGYLNTALGAGALDQNTTGYINTATGSSALASNTTGDHNTATGSGGLYSNTTGNSNTTTGAFALTFNTTGNSNTATGAFALDQNTTGNLNTATGASALLNNTTGCGNIAVGFAAGATLTTGNNNIDIGNAGVAGEDGITRIGTTGAQTATFIAGIRETPLAQGVAMAVGITADGQLGVKASSARFKEAIKPMDNASEAILSLRPVTFRYKKRLDPKATPQFGLVAEEVAKVDADLVARDATGKPFTVRYDEVNAMLLNEFLKEHRKVGALEATIAAQEKDFKSQIAALTATLKAQAAQIQKVSDQLRTQALAPRVVDN